MNNPYRFKTLMKLYKKNAQGYATGGIVDYDPNNKDDVFGQASAPAPMAPKVDPLSMFAPGALDKKPLAQYDDRAANQMNTDSLMAHQNANSSILDKLKQMSGGYDKLQAQQKEKQKNAPAEANPAVNSLYAQSLTPLQKFSDGGQVGFDESFAEKFKKGSGFAEGGSVPAAPRIDPEKAKQIQDSFKKAMGFYDGAAPVPEPENNPLSKFSPEDIQSFLSQQDPNNMSVNIRPDEVPQPEEPKRVPVDFQEPSVITAKIPKKPTVPARPASEMSMRDESPDDKQLENQYQNEDFVANEEADKAESKDKTKKQSVADKEPGEASDSEEPLKLPKEEQSPTDRLIAAIAQSKHEDATGLAEAQKKRDRNIMDSQIGKYGALTTGGMLKVDPSQLLKVAEENDKYVNMPVQKYDEQVKNKENDPTSPMSQFYRQTAAKFLGKELPENYSASDIAKALPMVEKYVQAQETAKSRAEVAKDRMAQQAQSRELAMEMRRQGMINTQQFRQFMMGNMQSKLDELTDKRTGDAGRLLGDKLTLKGAPKAVTDADVAIQRAHNIFATAGVDEKLTPEQIDKVPASVLSKVNIIAVPEMAQEVNRLLTGSGAPPVQVFNKLVPKDVNMSAAQFMSFFSNTPEAAKNPEYVRAYLKIASRVKELRQHDVNNYRQKVLSSASYLKEKRPDLYNEMLETYELKDPSQVLKEKKEGKAPAAEEKKGASKGSVSKSLLADYMKKHAVDESTAVKTLQNAGYDVEGH